MDQAHLETLMIESTESVRSLEPAKLLVLKATALANKEMHAEQHVVEGVLYGEMNTLPK